MEMVDSIGISQPPMPKLLKICREREGVNGGSLGGAAFWVSCV